MQVVTGWGQCEVTSVWGIPDYSCPSEEEASKTSSTWSLCPSPCCQSDVQQTAIDAEGAGEWGQFVEEGKKCAHTCVHMPKDAHAHTCIHTKILHIPHRVIFKM